jgi:hypothetical protein
MQVNNKRVVRIMREHSLLRLRPKRFLVTTNSSHKFEVYLNFAALRTKFDQSADCLYLALAHIIPSTKWVTCFSRRRIGRGVRESSSSPAEAYPA